MRYRRRAAGLLFASAMSIGLAVGAAVPAGAATSGNYVQIYAGVPGVLCLQPLGGALANGTRIVQDACSVSDNPVPDWAMVSLGGTSYQFVNKASGDCLDARGGAASGTPVELWPCGNISNERWTWPPPQGTGLDLFRVVGSQVAGTSTFCLDDSGASTQPDNPIEIYHCNGTGAQDWSLAA